MPEVSSIDPTEMSDIPPNAIRTVRLNSVELEALLDSLDEQAKSTKAAEKRAHKRFRFRRERCVIHIQQPGDAADMAFLCPTRDISAEGMSFLHGGYVHIGSNCAIYFGGKNSAGNGVCGRVVRCTYVGSGLYDVGVLFRSPIRTGKIVRPTTTRRVLLAEDDITLAQLEIHLLRQLNAVVDHAPDGQAAVELAGCVTYDVILMDMNMPRMTGYEAATALRRKGYKGTIIAVTALDRPEQIQQCLDAGCDHHLQKPFTQADLAALLESLPPAASFGSSATESAASDLQAIPGRNVEHILSELPARLEAITAAARAEDARALEVLLSELRTDMEKHGLTDMANTTARIEAAVVARQAMQGIHEGIAELTKLCLDLSSPRSD